MLESAVQKFSDFCSNGEYFEHIIHHIIQCFVREGQVVVDGGAHLGLHTYPLCKKVGHRGRVYAIEPIPRLANMMKEKALPQLRVIEAALMDSPGEVTFYHCTNDEGRSAIKRNIYPVEPTLDIFKVAARTLDTIIPHNENVRFIKLDLEGAEFYALRGAMRILKRDRPLVVFEHGCRRSAERYNYNLEAYGAFWADLGYTVVDLFGRPRNGDLLKQWFPWYLVAGADEASLALINNMQIPIALATQSFSKTNSLSFFEQSEMETLAAAS